MSQLQDTIYEHLQQLDALRISFEKELQELPAGSLYMQKGKHSDYYYHCYPVGGSWKRTILKLKDPNDALTCRQLQRRRFILSSLPVLKGDIAVLNQTLNEFTPYDPQKICENLAPVYQEIKKDKALWLPCEPDLKIWSQEHYWRSNNRPQDLIHETVCGLFVRSKSEAMITDLLVTFGIPFRYEQVLVIGQKHYAPDFTILRPRDRKLMYWEHFGRMDDPSYVHDTAKKIMDYRDTGIRTGENFIHTYENSKRPLTSREIYDTIHSQLL